MMAFVGAGLDEAARDLLQAQREAMNGRRRQCGLHA